MPVNVNQLRIKDLPALTQQADLLDKNFEVENPAGSGTDKNYRVSFPTVVQAVSNNLPGANALKSLIKSVKCYDTTDPQYYPGNSTLTALDPATLCGGTLCYVEFPKPSRMYRLHIDASGPIGPVSIDGDFNGNTGLAKWEEVGSIGDLTSAIADFNPFAASYAVDDTVKYIINGRLRLFSARVALVKSTFSTNRIPAPTGLGTDPNWAEVNPYLESVPNNSRLGQLACRFYTNAERAADPYPIGDTVEDLTARENAGADILYANRAVTVELGPHAGTYRVVYEPTNPKFHAYVDGSFTSGKNPCKWELIPAGGSGGISLPTVDLLNLTTAQMDEVMALAYTNGDAPLSATPAWSKPGMWFDALNNAGVSWHYYCGRGNYTPGTTGSGIGPRWSQIKK
jgi:hypothetical protein